MSMSSCLHVIVSTEKVCSPMSLSSSCQVIVETPYCLQVIVKKDVAVAVSAVFA
jgi:hypothetical protein